MPKQKATLKVIADHANLSIASVSRVLRKPQLTSWATQKRVRDAIKQLNLDTSSLFQSYRALNAHQESAVNKQILIIDNQLQPYSLLNHSIENELTLHGYQVFYLRFANVNELDVEQIIHYCMHHVFHGILIINEAPYLHKLINYQKALPPIVLVNHFSLDFSCVYFDHLMLAYYITSHFVTQPTSELPCCWVMNKR